MAVGNSLINRVLKRYSVSATLNTAADFSKHLWRLNLRFRNTQAITSQGGYTMQHIKKETLTIADINKAHNVELDTAMWAFIVKAINYKELTFDAKTNLIHIDGYVPFAELAKEWINGIADGSFDVRKCDQLISKNLSACPAQRRWRLATIMSVLLKGVFSIKLIFHEGVMPGLLAIEKLHCAPL